MLSEKALGHRRQRSIQDLLEMLNCSAARTHRQLQATSACFSGENTL